MQGAARGGRSRLVAVIAVLASIAVVAASAAPAQAVPVQRGLTTLTFDQDIFSTLDPLGIGILPVAPAVATLGGEAFPVSGGRVSRNGQRGTIKADTLEAAQEEMARPWMRSEAERRPERRDGRRDDRRDERRGPRPPFPRGRRKR